MLGSIIISGIPAEHNIALFEQISQGLYHVVFNGSCTYTFIQMEPGVTTPREAEEREAEEPTGVDLEEALEENELEVRV